MTIYEAMTTRRTIRRFDPKPIPEETLKKAVNVARLAPVGANAQSLKFCVVKTPELVSAVFDLSKWGMHLKDGSGRPKPGQLPTAWILILNDTDIKAQPMVQDIGAAAENIIIYATGEGIATCWLENIDRAAIAELLGLPENLKVCSSVALGYPGMAAREVPLPESGATPYYWGEDGVLCVPKRSLEDVMLVK
ncbi:MAG: nitroreductase family protein [Clostridia bacterium]|jgi:nitroreductase|nr:nitroreductase family protein [Clostridia bacterium]MBQ6000973.1 nitroreductase family protein [Clostridia bacterium]MBQ6058891.1 nitroreductase family protein [Clostridia bacterium]